MINNIFNRISFKVGFLFSIVFLILLILIGYMLYGIFINSFIDYISQDLINRGNNHAKVLEENYNSTTLHHVILMEKNVITSVVVTDSNKKVLGYSDIMNDKVMSFLNQNLKQSGLLNKDWKNTDYIVTISPINRGNKGYVYMFYPTKILNDIVVGIKIFVITSIIGVILLAIGLISFLSKKMTHPLLEMKKATNKIAKGDYNQQLDIKGKDELAQLAYSIQSLGEQLQYYENTRNEFLAGVSHELRTPITYIKGYSDILIKGILKDKNEQQKYLKIINEETSRVSRLVNDLFEISKIESNQFHLKKERVDMNALIEKVLNNLTPLAEKKELGLKFKSTKKKIYLYADPFRLEQVFFNLIENAIKYTDAGEIEIEIKELQDVIKVAVKDTGIGIPEKELSKIWDSFYRVDKSRTRQTGGTGLGLNLVKKIVHLHQGDIEAKSIEGKGTTFTIIFSRKEVSTDE